MHTTTASRTQRSHEFFRLVSCVWICSCAAPDDDAAAGEVPGPDARRDENADDAGALDPGAAELTAGNRLVGADVATGVELVLGEVFDVGFGVGFLTATDAVGVGEGGGGGAAARAAGSATSYTALCTPSLPTITEPPSRVNAIASSCLCSGTGKACRVPFTPTAQ